MTMYNYICLLFLSSNFPNSVIQLIEVNWSNVLIIVQLYLPPISPRYVTAYIKFYQNNFEKWAMFHDFLFLGLLNVLH